MLAAISAALSLGIGYSLWRLRSDVGKRAAAEAAHRTSEERLRLLGDNLPESYVCRFMREPDGRPGFLYVSAGVVRVHGVTPEQVLSDAGAITARFSPPNCRPWPRLNA